MVTCLRFSVNEAHIKHFFVALHRATWCCGKAIVFFPSKKGIKILASTTGFHFEVEISCDALDGYHYIPSTTIFPSSSSDHSTVGGSKRQRYLREQQGEEDARLEDELSDTENVHDEKNYLSVSLNAIRCVTRDQRNDPTHLSFLFDGRNKPDEVVIFVDYTSTLKVRKEFRLKRVPLPPVLLQLPPLQDHTDVVDVGATGKWWLSLLSRTFCLFTARPNELEVRWMDPPGMRQIGGINGNNSNSSGSDHYRSTEYNGNGREGHCSPSSFTTTTRGNEVSRDRSAITGEDVISVPHSSFWYVHLLPRLPSGGNGLREANISHQASDESFVTSSAPSALPFVYPPPKAVPTKFFRQACLLLYKLGLGMQVSFAGPNFPVVIQSIENPFSSSSSLHWNSSSMTGAEGANNNSINSGGGRSNHNHKPLVIPRTRADWGLGVGKGEPGNPGTPSFSSNSTPGVKLLLPRSCFRVRLCIAAKDMAEDVTSNTARHPTSTAPPPSGSTRNEKGGESGSRVEKAGSPAAASSAAEQYEREVENGSGSVVPLINTREGTTRDLFDSNHEKSKTFSPEVHLTPSAVVMHPRSSTSLSDPTALVQKENNREERRKNQLSNCLIEELEDKEFRKRGRHEAPSDKDRKGNDMSASSSGRGTTRQEPFQPSSAPMQRTSTPGGTGRGSVETLIDFSTFQRSPTDCLDEALKILGDGRLSLEEVVGCTIEGNGSFFSAPAGPVPPLLPSFFDGAGGNEDEDEDDFRAGDRWGEGTKAVDMSSGDKGNGEAGMSGEIRLKEEEVDEEMEAFLRDCTMTSLEMEQHPWDGF